MEKELLADFQKRLLAEREMVTKKLAVLNEGLMQPMGDSIGELSMYDNHPADIGDELYEREKDLSFRNIAQDQLTNVDRALAKIEDQTYGLCDNCGSEISYERLDALPVASLCIQCKKVKNDFKLAHPPVDDQVSLAHGGKKARDPFGKKFTDVHNQVMFDGEDAWQSVASFGTSDTPQDLGGEGDAKYPYVYIDEDEDVGTVQDVEKINYRRDREGTISKDYTN